MISRAPELRTPERAPTVFDRAPASTRRRRFPPLRVRVPRDLASVSSRRPGAETDPREVGMTQAGVDAIWAAAERLYKTGTQPAIALCVRRRGKTILDRAIGHERGLSPAEELAAPVLASPATPFCIFSISKAVTAMLVHHLDDRGLLHIDDAVAEYIPEFGSKGKENITLRHVLTHRAGIPSVAGNNDPGLLGDWEHIVELLCEAEPAWVAGRRLGYHAITGGYVLGEVVRRVTGKTIRQVLRETVKQPLGLPWFEYGVRPEDVGRVARSYFTGARVPALASRMVQRALGVRFEEAAEIANDPRYLTAIVPAGNVIATAAELAAFFQLLLDGGVLGGVRVFDRRTVRRALTETSYLEVDMTLGIPMRYGLGMMLGRPWVSPYGPHTPRAFGHYGFINTIGWADPDRQVAAALLTSGKPFVGAHLVRLWDLLGQIAKHCSPA